MALIPFNSIEEFHAFQFHGEGKELEHLETGYILFLLNAGVTVIINTEVIRELLSRNHHCPARYERLGYGDLVVASSR